MADSAASGPPLVALVDFPPRPDTGEVDQPNPQGTQRPPQERQRHAFGPALHWLVATEPSQVASVIDTAHEYARQGHWCLGWVAFEAASAFDAALPVLPPQTGEPLAVFAVFDHAHPWPEAVFAAQPMPLAAWQTQPWQSPLSPATFKTQVGAIHELIRNGEVYQINLTTTLNSALTPGASTTPLAYFEALHRSQPKGYAAYLDTATLPPTPETGGAPSHVLSVSPELFFHWQDGRITTRPMKGTAARGATQQADADAARHLQTSAKERAENLMIVDLLRNDLSRIAEVGSVQVPSLFDVQALPTVWQMTSTVQARTRADLRLSDIFAALFPCGSVTGAPKRRAMHHIAALEGAPRGLYCGAMGLMTPGGEVTFNVPIRTVVLHLQPGGWQAHCGIGSGITLDATAEAEAQEWQQKQAFLRRAAQPFDLLESLRLDHGHITRLTRHLERLTRAAAHFNFPLDEASIHDALARQSHILPHGVHKIRLRVDAHGQVLCDANPLAPTATDAPPIRVNLACQPMPPADEFIAHKTTHRLAYAPFTPPPGCFDTLLWNPNGEITEFTIGNVAVQLQGDATWYTPPLSAGLLPGVMRETLLAEGRLQERTLTLDDVRQAQGLALINSVRGWLDVVLAPTQKIEP
ncbi:MAG: chorismate-binding protein [Burkholderiales bacterium]|nr:chorismate-binding protein [Burkholderiales bacterium]